MDEWNPSSLPEPATATALAPRPARGPSDLEFFAPSVAAKRRRLGVVGLAVALIAGTGGVVALRGSGAEAATLRHTFAAGKATTYGIQVQMHIVPRGVPEAEGPIDATMTATLKTTVADVQPDGTATVDVTVSGISVTGLPAGQAPPPSVDRTVRMTVSADGDVLSVQGDQSLFDLPGASTSPTGDSSLPGVSDGRGLFATFPKEAIRPGHSWTTTKELPFIGSRKLKTTTRATFEAYESTPFGRTARIRQAVTIPMNFELPIGEFMAGLAQAFGQAGAPPGLDKAKIVFKGSMDADAVSRALLDGGDLVSLDGTLKIDMRFIATGFPPELRDSGPNDFSVSGDVRIRIDRTA